MRRLWSFGMWCGLAACFARAAFGSVSGIVISQVYGGGGNTGATYRNDFIELFNAGNSTVDVTGWSVQYAAATSGTWQVTMLSGSVAPGHYYLVQEAAGTGGTVDLPSPDSIGSIGMSAAAGKVALLNNAIALSATRPASEGIIDLIGYGSSANCFEGSGPAPAPSNTTAVLRGAAGCTDTDGNAADFAAGTPNPRNSASAPNLCASPISTATETCTASATEAPTATASFTFTSSVTPSHTPTPSETETATPTKSATATAANTPTETPTDTPSPTASETATASATATPTETTTNTPTETPTDTPSPTASETATATPTETATDTPTETPTDTPSPTASETATATPTETATDPPTPTVTDTTTPTPTETPTHTATEAPTRTAAPTETPTVTATATLAPTTASTATATVTPSHTPTQVPIDSRSATPTATATPACGDGHLDAGEECDDGNAISGDACPAECSYSASRSLIRGGRTGPLQDAAGCQVEWYVATSRTRVDAFGLPASHQVCNDQDPTCDFDSRPARCGFEVVVCLNTDDANLPACSNKGVRSARVLPTRPRLWKTQRVVALAAANEANIQDALTKLLDPNNPEAGYTNHAPLSATQKNFCTAPVRLEVLTGPRAHDGALAAQRIRILSYDGRAWRPQRKISSFRLECRPKNPSHD